MQRTIKAKYKNGHIVPIEPLDMEEGRELLVTVEERTHDNADAEDGALARAIAEGLESAPVDRKEIIGILQSRDEARVQEQLQPGLKAHTQR